MNFVWSDQRPVEDANGHYWWYKPGAQGFIRQEPQIVLVRFFRGAIRAFYLAGDVRQVEEMNGRWAGPIPEPCEQNQEDLTNQK